MVRSWSQATGQFNAESVASQPTEIAVDSTSVVFIDTAAVYHAPLSLGGAVTAEVTTASATGIAIDAIHTFAASGSTTTLLRVDRGGANQTTTAPSSGVPFGRVDTDTNWVYVAQGTKLRGLLKTDFVASAALQDVYDFGSEVLAFRSGPSVTYVATADGSIWRVPGDKSAPRANVDKVASAPANCAANDISAEPDALYWVCATTPIGGGMLLKVAKP